MNEKTRIGIKKEILYKYFDEKLTIDEITGLTDLSYKTIAKYYTFYIRERKRISSKNNNNNNYEPVIKEIDIPKKPKKKKECNRHIIKAESIEDCKMILALREKEIKEVNVKINRLIKRIISLETENQKLRDKNIDLFSKLENKSNTFKIY